MSQDKEVVTDPQRIVAQRIVQEASGVLRARGDVYGTLEEDFKITAGLWSAFFGIEISPDEVTQAMVLLKIGRTKSGDFSEDNYIDQAGYSGISAALADPSRWQEELELTKADQETTGLSALGRSKSFGQGISQRGNVAGQVVDTDSSYGE